MSDATGDGGFGVNPTCLATAVEQGIACTWVVMNNSAFGTIAGLENANYQTKFGTVFHTPDGAALQPLLGGRRQGLWRGVHPRRQRRGVQARDGAGGRREQGGPSLPGRSADGEHRCPDARLLEHQRYLFSQRPWSATGKLVQKENGVYITPNHAKSHKAK